MTLIFDTETTGKVDFKKPPEHPSQPRMVQLGAILFTAERKPLIECNLLIMPEAYSIPAEAAAVHGITTEMALNHGVSVKVALSVFISMARGAKRYACFNSPFDQSVLSSELNRLGWPWPLASKSHTDVMLSSTHHCKLPGKYGDYKWPKLSEAYRHFFGKDFDGAHDALADVRATAEILWRLDSIAVEAAQTAS